MKRVSFVALFVLSAALLPGAAGAQEVSPTCPNAQLYNPWRDLPAYPGTYRHLTAGEILLLPLEDLATGARLQVDFVVDGKPFVSESLIVPAKVPPALASPFEPKPSASSARDAKPIDGPPALVLLSRNQEEVRAMNRQALSKAEITVTVTADGREIERLAYGDFLARGRELSRKPFVPVAVESSVTGPALGASADFLNDANCEYGCQLDYDWCRNQNCGGGDYWACDQCTVTYNQCVDYCRNPPPPPTCTPKIEYFQSTNPLFGVPTGFRDCVPDWFQQWGWESWEYLWTWEVDLIERETFANCSRQERVVSVGYFFLWCHQITPFRCWPPSGFPPYVC